MAKKTEGNETVYLDQKHFDKVEDRQPDQIADYHKTHPTLKANTEAHKAEPPSGGDGDATA